MLQYKTILVYVDFHGAKAERIGVAAGLAKRFGTDLLGVAACQIPSSPTPLGGKRFKEFEQHEIEEQFDKLREQFLAGLGQSSGAAWHAHVGSPIHTIADHARGADLIIVSAHDGADLTERDIGDLVMIAGRPVLVPAAGISDLPVSNVLVAWKNTRESRRAVADALPFLVAADRVTVVSVGKADDAEVKHDLDGVVGHLKRHGVNAEPSLVPPDRARHITEQLIDKAKADKCGLIVAGAYGHSRFREIAFGGVTRDLLHQHEVSVLLSS